MLASNVDEQDALALPRSPTKQKSMLKKTFKVIGKVKPFKKNKTKTMELMNSCASFDFDAERNDCDGTDALEQTESDIETTEVEEGEAELEKIFRRADHVKESCDDGNDDVVKEDGEVVVQRARFPNPGEGTQSTTGSSLPSRKPNQTPSDLQIESPRIARRSRSINESSSRSPVGSSMSSSLRSSQRSATITENVATLPSTRSSPLHINTKNATVDNSKTSSSSQAVPPEPPIPLPDQTVGARDDVIAEPLKRCSEAFSDNSAMGGYFAKLQERVHSETNKTQLSTVQDNSVDPRKALVDKGRRQFKPSKNIKKLLGMKRTDAEIGDPKRNSLTVDPELSTKDEAANLMLQLNTLLVANTVDRQERRHKSHTTRASRSVEVDEIDEEDFTHAFPDIPAAKKTSLSEIRRMMASPDINPLVIQGKGSKQHPSPMPRRETRSFVFDHDEVPKPTLAAQARLSNRHKRRSASHTGEDSVGTTPSPQQHQFGRTQTSDRSRASKSNHERSHRRSSTGNHGTEAGDYDKSPKNSFIMNHSPTSVAAIQTGDNEETEQETLDSPRSRKRENLRSQSSRKGNVHAVQKLTPNSPRSSLRRPPSTTELGNTEPDSVEVAPMEPASSQLRRSTSIQYTHDSISVTEDNDSASREIDTRASPMALDMKRVHRRQGERRSDSDLGKQQDTRSDRRKRSSASSHEAISSSCPQKLFDVRKSKDFEISAQSSDSMMKVQRELALKNGSKKDGRNDGGNLLASPSKIHVVNATPLPRSRPHNEKSDPTSLNHHNTTKKLSNNRSQEDTELEKTKNPSLAKSLERDRSFRSMARNDCQHSVSTDGGSEMFVTVKGKNLYSKIRSDDSVAAPQLVIGANGTSKNNLVVKNV